MTTTTPAKNQSTKGEKVTAKDVPNKIAKTGEQTGAQDDKNLDAAKNYADAKGAKGK